MQFGVCATRTHELATVPALMQAHAALHTFQGCNSPRHAPNRPHKHSMYWIFSSSPPISRTFPWHPPPAADCACDNAILLCPAPATCISCQTPQPSAHLKRSSSWKAQPLFCALEAASQARPFQSQAPFGQRCFREGRGSAFHFVLTVLSVLFCFRRGHVM